MKERILLLVLFIFLVIAGMAVTGGGVWIALHLKHLPAYPMWIIVGCSTLITLRTGQLLIEIIKDE